MSDKQDNPERRDPIVPIILILGAALTIRVIASLMDKHATLNGRALGGLVFIPLLIIYFIFRKKTSE